ncbi:hypothetical protein [Actinoplanes sp. NPDC023714]|uniref:GatB/YqeY domain-containing protein n=1 Tax=Actinoplanes sp. NPDC023714 TaxID=3154322 RepID=UPI0033C3122D
MPLPLTDSGFDSDKNHLLAEIGGPVAQLFLDVSSAIHVAAPTPLPPPTIKSSEVDAFTRTCKNLQEEAKHNLDDAMAQTSAMNCGSLAVLLGQIDLRLRSITGSPNAFSYEIELIVASRPGPSWTEKIDVGAALRALREARKFNAYSHLLLFAEGLNDEPHEFSWANVSLGSAFSTEWLSGRGKFFTAYDLRYLDAIRKDLALHGIHRPDARAAHALAQPFIRRWNGVVSRLMNSLPPGSLLARLATSQSLLTHDKELTADEHEKATAALTELSLTSEDILNSLPREFQQEAAVWLETLTLSNSTSDRSAIHPYMDSPLRQRPIMSARSRNILALPHKITTDLSSLIGDSWSLDLKESYFSARARSVESLSIQTLSEVFSGCRTIEGAYYSSRDGRIRGEVDGILVWHDVCLIIEGKGGYLSIAARRGSEEAALSDLRQTVSEGFFQASRLARVLELDRCVELRTASGEALTLQESALRRLYVVIPTADDLSVVATQLPILWGKGLLPRGSLPLIVSTQDLMLMADALGSATEMIAYLDFREEVLSSTYIHMADEMEVLGAFVGGIDIVGEARANLADKTVNRRFDRKRKFHLMQVAPVQQERHISPWLAAKFGRSINGDDAVPRPSRHSSADRHVLHEMWESKPDVASQSAGINLPRQMPEVIVGACAELPVKGVRVRRHNAISAIAFPRSMSLDRVQRSPDVKKATELSRYVIFVQLGDGRPELAHVALGKKHPRFKLNRVRLALRSGIPLHDGWYASMEAKRSKLFDKSLVAALETEGLSRDVAVGVVRAGLAEKVRATSSAGAGLAKSAALWMGEISYIASTLKIRTADFPLPVAQIARILSQVEERVLPKSNVAALLRLSLRTPETDPHTVARDAGLLASDDTDALRTAIRMVLQEEPDAARKLRSGKTAVQNFLLGQVARNLGRKPRADLVMKLLNEEARKEHGDDVSQTSRRSSS